MTRLQTLADYRRELAALDSLIADAARRDDFAARVTLSGLRARRDELAEELAALTDTEMPGHELQVVFRGDPVLRHSIDADFLGRMLTRIQRLVRSAVSVGVGRNRRTGRFARPVESAGRLRFAGSFESSFGMRLESIDEQLEFNRMVSVAPTFDALVNALQHEHIDRGLLRDLAALGARATDHYRDILNQLRIANADMTVTWPSVQGQRSSTIDAATAARLAAEFDSLEQNEVGRTHVGTLEAGHHLRGEFAFLDDAGTVFEGKTSPDLLENQADYFLRRCKAWIVTTTVTNRITGDTAESHRLLELAPEGAPDFPPDVPQDPEPEDT